MKRVILFILIAYLTFSLSSFDAEAQERTSLYVSDWSSSSDSWWQISGDGPTYSFVSRLDYNETDSNVTILGGSFSMNERFDLKASYGFGDVRKGRVTDADWIRSTGLNNHKFSESISKGSGDTQLLELGSSLLFSNNEKSGRLYLYGGYFQYKDDIRMKNGVQTISDNGACAKLAYDTPCIPSPGSPLSGLNSRYNFKWEFLKLGLEGDLPKGKIIIEGGIYYLLPMSYRGEGYWNLRVGPAPNGFRAEAPNFAHEAYKGSGLDGYLSISYDISKSSKFSIGYKYFKLETKKGMDSTFFTDGLVGTAMLDAVKAERKGPYISIKMARQQNLW